MPDGCFCRLLLLVWLVAPREAPAKSLPDQGALGKLTGMQHNDGMGVVAFMAFVREASVPSVDPADQLGVSGSEGV